MTGFGAFLDVEDNPSGRLARALDGARLGELSLVGEELEVGYDIAPARTLERARQLDARFILGFGVSRTGGVRVERTGRARLSGTPDVRGLVRHRLTGPDVVYATLDVSALAAELGCHVSDDAGGYVCNAWLHQVSLHAAVPVAFVHIPPEGVLPERVLAAIERWWRADSAGSSV